MPIGKSRRIVIDVDDVSLKRGLYSALATEGRSLKDWFAAAANDYLTLHSQGASARSTLRVAEKAASYRPSRRKKEA
jgi:hypothetical protein